MNGAAHIMNDEATRKYLQAIKRLQTFMQRAYPTDPSRSVDFDGFRDAGLGAKGAGSDKAVSPLPPCLGFAVKAKVCMKFSRVQFLLQLKNPLNDISWL